MSSSSSSSSPSSSAAAAQPSSSANDLDALADQFNGATLTTTKPLPPIGSLGVRASAQPTTITNLLQVQHLSPTAFTGLEAPNSAATSAFVVESAPLSAPPSASPSAPLSASSSAESPRFRKRINDRDDSEAEEDERDEKQIEDEDEDSAEEGYDEHADASGYFKIVERPESRFIKDSKPEDDEMLAFAVPSTTVVAALTLAYVKFQKENNFGQQTFASTKPIKPAHEMPLPKSITFNGEREARDSVGVPVKRANHYLKRINVGFQGFIKACVEAGERKHYYVAYKREYDARVTDRDEEMESLRKKRVREEKEDTERAERVALRKRQRLSGLLE